MASTLTDAVDYKHIFTTIFFRPDGFGFVDVYFTILDDKLPEGEEHCTVELTAFVLLS